MTAASYFEGRREHPVPIELKDSALPFMSPLDPSPRAQALEEAAKAQLLKDADWLGEYGHQLSELECDQCDGGYTARRLTAISDRIDAAIRALASQPVAATQIIGEGATVWLRVDENKDGSQEITVTEAQGFSEVPDGEYLFIRHGSSQPVADGWLPIETAPKDGTSVEVYDSFIPGKDGFAQVIARHDKEHGWHVAASVVGGIYIKLTNPTHWRPLPTPPATRPTGGRNHGE